MKVSAIGAVLVLAVGSAATAVGAAAPPADQPAQQEKKICRSEKMTGSLTRRTRICMTEREWRELNDRTRRGVNELQGSGSGAPACISSHDAACGTAPGPGGIPGQ